jgi:hypothetical protein
MSLHIHRLIYVSRWTTGLGDDVGAALHRIVAASMAKNRQADITGLLLAHEGWFVQVLEGAEPDIGALIVRIACDPRHRDLKLLFSGPDETRQFGDWDMASAKLGPEADPLLTELGLLARFDGHALDADAAMRLLALAADTERAREQTAA